jgi:hypothetical protein
MYVWAMGWGGRGAAQKEPSVSLQVESAFLCAQSAPPAFESLFRFFQMSPGQVHMCLLTSHKDTELKVMSLGIYT